MLKELLGDQYDAVIKAAEEKGVSLIADSKKEPKFVPIERVHTLTRQKSEVEEQLKAQETALAEAKKGAGDNPELLKKLETLEADKLAITEKYQKAQIEYAIKTEALKANAVDADDILKLTDLSILKLQDDGTVKGAAEQIKALSESKPHLFTPTADPTKVPPQPGNPPKIHPGGSEAMANAAKIMGVQLPTV